MNILNIEGTYFVDEFKKKGHNVLSIGPLKECDLKVDTLLSPKKLIDFLKIKNFKPDIVIWNDICRLPSVLGFEMLPCITIGYSIDQYCNPWHIPFFSIFDCVFIAQKDYINLFKKQERPQKIDWLPLFFNPKFAFKEDKERDILVSFVGTIEGSINKERANFLKNFSKYIPIVIKQGNYQPVYSRSKIVLNQSAAGELNFRIFEAMACGATLLTENVNNGLSELFEINEEILVYKRGDFLDAVKIANKWLNSDKLDSIADAGYKKVVKYHSAERRVERILKKAEKALMQNFYKWRLKEQKFIFSEIVKTFYFILGDNELNLSLEAKKEFNQIIEVYLKLSKGEI